MVSEVMDRVERLQVWKARQDREAEWYALKQWWRAVATVQRLAGKPAQPEALRELHRTERLFAAELSRAWPKWRSRIEHRAVLIDLDD